MVSIIIPYIDEHAYLAEAIASAKSQHGVDKEILIVCNAPFLPEGYNPVPEEMRDVQFIHQPIVGSAYARNAGLKAAKGGWIQFLDVDDLLLPDKIHHQLAHDDADVVLSPHTYVYLNGKTVQSKWEPDDFWCGLLDSGLGSTSSFLWKRAALEEAGGWNVDYQSHQEYELLFRLAAGGKKIVHDDHCETLVRQRESGSITTTSKPVRVQEGIRLRESIWDHLEMKNLVTPKRYDAFRQYIFKQLRGLLRQDRSKAMELYKKYFSSPPFFPKDVHVPGYSLVYRMLGFYKTEKLIYLFVSLRKKSLKAERLKS